MRAAPAAALRRRPWLPTGLRTAQFITGALVLAYLASTLLRARQSSSTLFDVWVANLGYAGCTALVVWRVIAVRRARWAWATMAAGLLLFTGGSVLWTAWVQHFNPLPYPSIADGLFLAFYAAAFVGVGLLVRQSVPKTARTIWLDGLIAGLGVAALEATLVIGSISQGNKGDFGTVATNVAHPIGDLMLVSMVVVVLAVRGWRPGRLWWTLGAGLVIFAAADRALYAAKDDGRDRVSVAGYGPQVQIGAA